MKPTSLYRIASGLLVVFAASHTFGLLSLIAPSPQARSVWDAMKNVHFQLMGVNCSYGDFYIGFGLLFTAYLLFSAVLAWHLGGLARNNPEMIGALGWSFFAVQAATFALSWMYFFPAPVVVSGLAALCLGWAAWLVKASKAEDRLAANEIR